MRTICFLERAGCAGGGKGILCSEEKTFTLSTVDNMRMCMQEEKSYGIINQPERDDIEFEKLGTIRATGHTPMVAHVSRVQVLMDQGGGVMNVEYGKTGTLRRETHGHKPIIHHNTVVRRLTPVECERLQGFHDNFTNIPWANKATAPDSRRYKALGNSMAVPVMHWIGKRMMEAREVVCDEAAIDRILYVTPSDDGQLSLF